MLRPRKQKAERKRWKGCYAMAERTDPKQLIKFIGMDGMDEVSRISDLGSRIADCGFEISDLRKKRRWIPDR